MSILSLLTLKYIREHKKETIKSFKNPEEEKSANISHLKKIISEVL